MPDTIILPRFCGPPNSGNGGYVCGLLAEQLAGIAEVTLRIPPPLSRPLDLELSEGTVRLLDGDQIVGEAHPGQVDFEAPDPPSFEEAAAAARHYIGFVINHPFPTCFVCGPEREAGDGLCIYPGKVDASGTVAAPWEPDASLADADGFVRDEFIWAALDCPGAFAIMGAEGKKIVLGRMAADIRGKVRTGERCVVTGWEKGQEGRKHYSGTAVFNSSGELCAVGSATWIDIGN